MATSCRYSHRTGRCKNSSRGRLSSRCTRSAKTHKCVLKKSYKKLRKSSSRRHSRKSHSRKSSSRKSHSRKSHSRKSHSRKHSRRHSRRHSQKDVKDIKIKSSLSRGKGQLYRDLKYQEFMKKFSKKLRKHGYSKDNVHKIAHTEFYRRFPSMKKYSS